MKKKKLILHIGYPKTATTTLQEGLFLNLHSEGKINYLGRTVSSTHTKSGRSAFNGQDWVMDIKRYLLFDEPLNFSSESLSGEKINVISDEGLCTHSFYYKATYNVIVEPFTFPEKLKKFFGPEIDVHLLVSIRNQPQLIFSYFIQKYNFIIQNIGNISFIDFINNKDTNFLDIYKFSEIIEQYKTVFDADATVLLFEDILNRPEIVFKQLSNLLGLSTQIIEFYLKNNHYRKKVKPNEFFTIYYNELNKIGEMVATLYGGEEEFKYILNKRKLNRSSIYQKKIEKKIFLKTQTKKIPKLKFQEKEILKNKFVDDNHKLSDRYDIDKCILKKYEYI